MPAGTENNNVVSVFRSAIQRC